MDTTLPLDPDVAQALERLRRQRHARLQDVGNDLLRRALGTATPGEPPPERYRSRSFDVGRLLVDVEDVAEALALTEGEHFR